MNVIPNKIHFDLLRPSRYSDMDDTRTSPATQTTPHFILALTVDVKKMSVAIVI